MRKIFIILFGLLSVVSFAEKIDRDKAIDVADKFFTSINASDKVVKEVTPVHKGSTTTQYIVNFEPEGWAILAADDRVRPVLAYSNTGSFKHDPKRLSPEVGYWLNEYNQQIESVVKDNKLEKHSGWNALEKSGYNQLKSVSASVSPLLNIEWDQGSGWNKLCPEDEDGPGGHAYVGCVAVAMAQSMYNVKLNAPLKGVHSYVHDTYGKLSVNFANEDPYDWDAMSLKSPADENTRLLYHCAVAVSMDFGPDGSGSYSSRIVGAMKRYFGYAGDVTYYERFEDDEDWKDLLKSELDKGNVLVYAGDPGTGEAGHCFNIDGYDINDYFHFNWGWSGRYNGFYSIENINPGSYKFNVNQDVIVGIAEAYYGPTDITLSSLEVKESLPVGSFVAEVSVKDNSDIDLFTYKLDGGPRFPSGINEASFYIEHDSLKTKKVFNASVKDEYLLNIKVTDAQLNTYSEEFIIKINQVSSNATPVKSITDELNVYYSKQQQSVILENNASSSDVRLEMFDLKGKKVVDRRISDDINTLNVSGQNKGIYIIRLSLNNQSLFRKILIN